MKMMKKFLILVHCNAINNNYQQNSRVLYTFVSSRFFDQLLDIWLKILYFEKPFIQSFIY